MLHHDQGTNQGPLLHRCAEAEAVSDFNYCSEEWNQAAFCNISLQFSIMFICARGFNWFNLAFQLWNKSRIHRRRPQCRREHKMLSWNTQNITSSPVKRPRSSLQKGLILSLLFTHHRLLFLTLPMKFHGSTCEIRSLTVWIRYRVRPRNGTISGVHSPDFQLRLFRKCHVTLSSLPKQWPDFFPYILRGITLRMT